MPIRDVAEWLLDNEGFQSHYYPLIADSVASQFGTTFFRETAYQNMTHDWRYLLMCASVLATSETEGCQDAALRIAQHAIEKTDMPQNRKDSSVMILDTLANKPAIILAERRSLLEPGIINRLPIPASIDWVRRDIEFSITMSDDSIIPVNRFQRLFWSTVQDNSWISISAPTSAGKSYIIIRWISDYLRQHQNLLVVYIVPTRALIAQVEKDLKSFFTHSNQNDIQVSTLPLSRLINPDKSNVLVFTQERLHLYLSNIGDESEIDVLIVDEAHKVGDRQRGVLLQQVIERVTNRNSETKIIFSSPLTSNPEVLLSDASPNIVSMSIRNEDITVNQNLIWVSQEPRNPKHWSLALCLPNTFLNLGKVELQYIPSPISKRLPFVAYAISGLKAGNVIYVNGPADAEKMAKQLYDLIGQPGDIQENDDINNLIALCRRTIHPHFALNQVLSRGIAFHYGNMPQLVRVEIERLFSTGAIRYLICTSTLVEGVNMSCKNIFLRGPQKGRGHPMSEEDFWNLAGRAGRWGIEFQGNIFCIDPNESRLWNNGEPPRQRRRFRIKRTADMILDSPDELISYINNGATRDQSAQNPDLEYVFSYLLSEHLRLGSISEAGWANRLDPDKLLELSHTMEIVIESLETPLDIIRRNPGISPLAMDSLLHYFRERGGEPAELLPADPSSQDAVQSYTAVFNRISTHLTNSFGRGGRIFMLALLVTRWMSGLSLARLIQDRIDYERRRNRTPNESTIIRQVMQDVEVIARFEAPRHLTCYTDLLKLHLQEIDEPELLEALNDLGMFLELGVSQETQISLMSLGLSRTTTVALSEIIASDSLTEEQCLEWLNTNLWQTADFPIIIKHEIENILALHSESSG